MSKEIKWIIKWAHKLRKLLKNRYRQTTGKDSTVKRIAFASKYVYKIKEDHHRSDMSKACKTTLAAKRPNLC